MKPANHEHQWQELSSLGDKKCRICGKRSYHTSTIMKELWSLPQDEREQIMLLIRRKYARFKRDYLDKEV